MVLLYMVCHGSHQYTPFMLALIYQHHGSVMGSKLYPSPTSQEALPILDTLQKMTSSLLVNVDIPINTKKD